MLEETSQVKLIGRIFNCFDKSQANCKFTAILMYMRSDPCNRKQRVYVKNKFSSQKKFVFKFIKKLSVQLFPQQDYSWNTRAGLEDSTVKQN